MSAARVSYTGGSRKAGFEHAFDLLKLGCGHLFRLLSLWRQHVEILKPTHCGINLRILRGLVAGIESQNLLIGLEGRLVLSLFRLHACGMKQLCGAQLALVRHAPRSQTHARRSDYG